MNTDAVIRSYLERHRAGFHRLADTIWETPELAFQEHQAAAAQADFLEASGFRVTRGVCGMPTAFIAEYGAGGPVIGMMGEYDALPALSQVGALDEQQPVVPGGAGHGCGHHMLGTGALMAACAVRHLLDETGIPGRIRYYGCPAEEAGDGKSFMVRGGAFDDVDVAMSWHPNAFMAVNKAGSLARAVLRFRFTGQSAHASIAPHLGRSALDAVELTSVGCNYLREHIPSSARVHYAILDAGGTAANVVQSSALVEYFVRTRELEELNDVVSRVTDVARGAALMTGTQVQCEVKSACANMVGVESLDRLVQSHLERLGTPAFDDQDKADADRFYKTFSPQAIRAAWDRFRLPPVEGQSLSDQVVPFYSSNPDTVGSTDIGTVSWKVPTAYLRGAVYAIGTPGHSWQLTAQGRLPLAYKGMEHTAVVLAASAFDLIGNPEKTQAIREDFARMMAGRPFIDPLPADAVPDFAIA